MNIIFHYPLPLNPDATSASGIRPLKMLEAFKSLGCQVDIVSGYSKDRKRSITKIKNNIKSGIKYDFMYCESSTMPTILTDSHHLPLHPLLDFSFFNFCNKYCIPIGLFYRDIFWLFEDYGSNLNPLKSSAAKLAYKLELEVYKRVLTKLYLPSERMLEYLPGLSKSKISALPPGHDVYKNIEYPQSLYTNTINKLKVFYVGGLNDAYQMHVMVETVNSRSDINLVICTRESEWNLFKRQYPAISNNIQVIHMTGESMLQFMKRADLVSLFIKPKEYCSFAVPFKLFEYIGHKKPIIASENTYFGDFVSQKNIGWSIPYSKKELNSLFDKLISNPLLIQNKIDNINRIVEDHTWRNRAQQVIEDLT